MLAQGAASEAEGEASKPWVRSGSKPEAPEGRQSVGNLSPLRGLFCLRLVPRVALAVRRSTLG